MDEVVLGWRREIRWMGKLSSSDMKSNGLSDVGVANVKTHGWSSFRVASVKSNGWGSVGVANVKSDGWSSFGVAIGNLMDGVNFG